VAVLALLVVASIFFRVRRPGDVTQHSVMASEFPEIWRALAHRQFALGDSAEILSSNVHRGRPRSLARMLSINTMREACR